MDREYLKKLIKDLKENIKTSQENKKKAEQHIEEGELILKTFEAELAKCT